MAARGYNLLPVVGRNAVNEAGKSRRREIELYLRTLSQIYFTISVYVPAFRTCYFYMLHIATSEGGDCFAIPKHNIAPATNPGICQGMGNAECHSRNNYCCSKTTAVPSIVFIVTLQR